MIYYVRVNYTKHKDYPMASGYNIDGTTKEAAETEARSRYARDFGFDINYITAKATHQLQEIK